MFAVRIHGRGGRGVVTTAELLSVAAFAEGRHAQAFPSFGSERTGTPVTAFCGIDARPIRTREPIATPDCVIVAMVGPEAFTEVRYLAHVRAVGGARSAAEPGGGVGHRDQP